MTGVELSIEEIDEITGDDVAYWLGNDFMSPDLLAEKVRSWISAVVAARLAPVEAEREKARGERPSGFWSQRQWEDWSNDLATLIPEDKQAGNPEGSQESIIEDTVRHLVAEVARLTDEVKHWKDHAEEAGRGFAQVCRDYARVSARNVELAALVEAGLGLADEWDQIHLTGFCDSCAGISLGNQRWIVKRLRDVLGGVTCDHEWRLFRDLADGHTKCLKCGVRNAGGAS